MNLVESQFDFAQSLEKQFGVLVGGTDLIKVLGYPSQAAFRQAKSRQQLPVTVFKISYRRGYFAYCHEIAKWLASLQDIPENHCQNEESLC